MTSSCQSFGLASSTSSAFTNAIPASTASPPSPPVSSRNCDDSTYIPRPPNCFILFRTSRIEEITQHRRVTGQFYRQSNLSRMLGREWKSLPEVKKREWQEKARIEKRLHAQKYPHYTYRPKIKPKRTVKKKVKKPSDMDCYSPPPTYKYNDSPHLDPILPFVANSNLPFHSSTWFCPPTNHSLFPSRNTALEFMNLDQLTGTYLEDFFPRD